MRGVCSQLAQHACHGHLCGAGLGLRPRGEAGATCGVLHNPVPRTSRWEQTLALSLLGHPKGPRALVLIQRQGWGRGLGTQRGVTRYAVEPTRLSVDKNAEFKHRQQS